MNFMNVLISGLEARRNDTAFFDPIAPLSPTCAFAAGSGAFIVLLSVACGLLLLATRRSGIQRRFNPHCRVADRDIRRLGTRPTGVLSGATLACQLTDLSSFSLSLAATGSSRRLRRAALGTSTAARTRRTLLSGALSLLQRIGDIQTARGGLRRRPSCARQCRDRQADRNLRLLLALGAALLATRTTDLAVADILVTGQLEITDHAVLGFLLGGLG